MEFKLYNDNCTSPTVVKEEVEIDMGKIDIFIRLGHSRGSFYSYTSKLNREGKGEHRYVF